MTNEGLSMESANPKKADQVYKLLNFSLRSEEYAIALVKVREVIALPDITPVPYMPSHFCGIMNLRGQVVSVIDLRTMLKMEATQVAGETAVIILCIDGLSLGVIVDAVNSVLGVHDADIHPPDFDVRDKPGCITGIIHKDDRLVFLLDIGETIAPHELKALRITAVNNKPIAAP
ncbi:chemotaxis protein CheW [Oligoflexus tunisiensis]|uniref:chemotaxis protein CheW n=1 Tax=Oligoflexus tunisiensis TaxID=708132 RepID=UPI00114D1B7B|nr:chemotaxis protein CheW [Oligoflexus tunisiensis]